MPLALAALVILYRVATIEVRVDQDELIVRNSYRTERVPLQAIASSRSIEAPPTWLNIRSDVRATELRVGNKKTGKTVPVMATAYSAHGPRTRPHDFSAWYHAETGRHLRGAPRPTGRRPPR